MPTARDTEQGSVAGLDLAEPLRPQPGPQEAFLSTPADFAIAGGAAGGGKSFGLQLEMSRNIAVPGFAAVCFRRTYPQIIAEGGLWDSSQEIYPLVGGVPIEGELEWRFPAKTTVRFVHMQRESDRKQWDSSQVPLICFDQVESFTWKQVSYMFSRNRTTCAVRPYMRATCNPDPDCWLREFMRWWIDDETGYAIPARSGVVRWFILRGNEVQWGASPEELRSRFGDRVRPKSFTFIPSTVEDNKILLAKNPEYLAELEALPFVDRMRLRHGNWNERDTAGSFFQRSWFEIVEAAPACVEIMRYWDRAGTAAEKASPLGSWTVGVKIGRTAQGVFYVLDVDRFQGTPLQVMNRIKAVATQDGRGVRVGIEVDPGQAGKAEAMSHVRNLAGFVVTLNHVHESKGVRAKPYSAQCEQGNVKLVRARWNDAYVGELVNFDGIKAMADQVDASSGGFYLLTSGKKVGTW